MGATTEELLDEGTRNSQWINEHMERLREAYGGEYIAVEDGSVIAHGEDSEQVIEEAEEEAGQPESVVISFVHPAGRTVLR